MSAKNRPAAKSNELKINRIYDAPVKTVWEAWNDPKQAAKWWGPRGFTLTSHSKELKPGGIWHYTMHGPDGIDYPNKTVYLEVEKYARLVYDHGGNDHQAPMFRVTVNFQEVKGKTKMDMTMTLPTPEAAEEARKFIKKAGGNATWDRLAEYLEKESSGKERFVINRSFDASIETIFEMWTDPSHFSKWLPPAGFTMKFLRGNIKPKASTLAMMTNGTITMYSRAEYLEISPPHHLVYTQQFVDENEKISRHPMAPTWPETMLTTVEFNAEGPEATRVTITWETFGNCTPEELATFANARDGMTLGWTGSLDKLDEVLTEK
jgi:uncharacterized protein YndB with AHSA1/START domain